MTQASNVSTHEAAAPAIASSHFATKLGCETDCSDVYADIKAGNNDFVLLDVRSEEAYDKSHAVSAINLPHSQITAQSMSIYEKDTVFVVYCWGPGCNGATKAGLKLANLGYKVKEMIGGIHYWEDFERYPVNRRVAEAQG